MINLRHVFYGIIIGYILSCFIYAQPTTPYNYMAQDDAWINFDVKNPESITIFLPTGQKLIYNLKTMTVSVRVTDDEVTSMNGKKFVEKLLAK